MAEPARTGATPLGAAALLWGALLIGAGGEGRAASGRDVPADAGRAHGGAVAPPSSPEPGPGLQQEIGATAFLRGMAETPPVACELVLRALGNRWGNDAVRPRVHEPLAPTEEQRATARWAWSDRPSAADVQPLMDGLASPDACVSRTAARLLRLLDHSDVPADVRERVRSAVRERARDAGGTERLAALVALGGFADEGSGSALEQALAAPDPEVRLAAAWALGQRERPAAVPRLGRALESDDPLLRENVAWALGRTGSRTALPALTDALTDPESGVRVNAAWALGEIEDPQAIPALSALLAEDGDAGVRKAAAWALGRIEE